MADFDLLWRAKIDASEAMKGSEEYARAQEQATEAAEKAAGKVKESGKKAAEGTSVWAMSMDDLGKRFDALSGGAVRFETVATAAKAGMAVAAAGAAALSVAVVKGVEAAIEAEDAQNRLRVALDAQGAATERNVAIFGGLATQLQQMSRFGDEDILGAEAIGLRLGVTTRELEGFTRAAVDMAAGLRISLGDAAEQLGRTLDGTAGRLTEKIPELNALSEAQLRAGDAIELVGGKFRGFAERDTATLGGAVAQLKQTWGEALEAFGEGFTGESGMVNAVKSLREQIELAMPQIQNIGQAVGELGKVAFNAANEVAFLFASDTNRLAGTAAGQYIEAQNAAHGLAVEIDNLAKRQAYHQSIIDKTGDSVTREQQTAELAKVTAELAAKQQELAGAVQAVAAAEKAKNAARGQAAGAGAPDLGTGPSRGAADSAASKAAADLEKQIQGYGALADAARGAVGVMDSLTSSEAERVSLASAYVAQIDSASQAILKLGAEQAIPVEQARALRADLEGAKMAILESTMDDRIAASSVTDVMQVPAGIDAGASDWSAIQREMRGQEAQQKQTILDIDRQRFELELAIAGQDAATLDQTTQLIDLRWQEAAALGQVTDAEAKLFAGREKMIAQEKAHTAAKKAGFAATMQDLSATLGAAASAVGAVTKSKKAQMAVQATKNVVDGIEQTALSYGRYAAGDFMGGTQHALAAVTHFAAASQAGGGGGGGAPGGGGGGGGGREESPYRRDSSVLDREIEQAPRGPTYQVAITGTLLGGQPQDQARAIQSYLTQFASESGGRSAPPRG